MIEGLEGFEGNKADHISNKDLKAIRKFRESVGHAFVLDGEVHDVRSKAVRRRMRTSHDARLLRHLGEDRVICMDLVWSAYMMIAAGMGFQTFNPFRTGGGKSNADRGKSLQLLYWLWAEELQFKRLSHSMCVEIAVFGYAPHEVDRNMRQRNGLALDNLTRCMDIFIELGGLDLWHNRD